MAYLGNPPAEAYTSTVKDSFNGDGSTTAFTLSQPSTTNNLRVVVENVIQDPTVAYSVSGTTLTFTSAPPSGTANIYAVHLGPATMTAVPPSEITNATTYTSDLTVQGDLTVDTNTLHVDSANNRVGVGTTSPVGSGIQIRKDTASTTNELLRLTNSYGSTTDGVKITMEVANTSGNGGEIGVVRDGGSYNPYMYFSISSGVGSAPTEAARLDSDGLKFNGDTAAANALDDYEEGTFTPNIAGSTPTYTHQIGRYTKIGRMVHATIDLYVSNRGDGSYNRIYGLPFTSANGSIGYSASVAYWKDVDQSFVYLSYLVENNATSLVSFGTTAGTTTLSVAPVVFGTGGGQVIINVCYQAA